jgi:hypothetical protein
MPLSAFVSPAEFVAYVTSRGYTTEPSLVLADDGVPIRIGGYILRGPHGNKTVVIKNEAGLLPLFDAELWCDGVDYSTAQLRRAS